MKKIFTILAICMMGFTFISCDKETDKVQLNNFLKNTVWFASGSTHTTIRFYDADATVLMEQVGFGVKPHPTFEKLNYSIKDSIVMLTPISGSGFTYKLELITDSTGHFSNHTLDKHITWISISEPFKR